MKKKVAATQAGTLRKRLFFMGLAATALICGLTIPARADIEISEIPKALDSFQIGLGLDLFYRVDRNPYFGAAVTRPDGADTFTDARWGEVFGKTHLKAGRRTDWADLTGQLGIYYALTADADAYGIFKDDTDIGLNYAWLEFGSLLGSPVDVRIGRQDIVVEKAFLVGDGGTQKAAAWLPLVSSFPFAVQAEVNLHRFKTVAFWARPGYRPGDAFGFGGTMRDGGDVDLYGANLHFDFTEGSYLYGGYFRTNDNSDGQDNNLNVWDAGGQLTLFETLVLEGEVASQTGTRADAEDVSAQAGWASLGYTFPVKLSPYIRGSYMFYSGDEDPTDDDNQAWNPFYPNFIGWNRWVQGEQTGEIWLIQTNKKVAVAEIGFAPLDNLFVSLHYLVHKLDEKYGPFTGAPLKSDDWAREVNLFFDSPVNENLFVHFGVGLALPGDAAKEEAANIDATPGGSTDEKAMFAQLWFGFSF